MPLTIAAAGEVEELFRDLLTAESFPLNHLQVIASDLHVLRPGGVGPVEQILQAPFQRFAAQSYRGQRIVDLMGNAGGEKADASELLAADHLIRPLLDLPVEIVANLTEPVSHRVHGFG